MIDLANVDQQILDKWSLSNRLTVNLSTTFHMVFTNFPSTVLPSLYIHNKVINITDKHTLLGLTYDDPMTFKPHIANLIFKMSRIVSYISDKMTNVC